MKKLRHSELLFAGTADGLAVYRADPGGSLVHVRRTLAGAAIEAIAVVGHQALLVAVAGAAPQQSFDGGLTWSAAAGPAPEPPGLQVMTVQGPAAVNYPRLSGATAYARPRGHPGNLIGAGAAGMMLFLSSDDGIHWSPARMDGGFAGSVRALIPSAEQRGGAWAGTDSGAILRTRDAGRSWQEVARDAAPILSLAAAGIGSQDEE